MADWPKKFLMTAKTITIITEGDRTFEMDGPTFVRCLESGGWVNNRCLFESCGRPRDHNIHSAHRPTPSGWKRHNFVN
jgi:hypothetical protein